MLAKNLGAINILGINTFDTYRENREKFIPKYVKQLSEMGILPDAIWHDRREKERIINVFKKLEEKGYLRRENAKVLKCECGKVEMLKESKTREKAKLYQQHDDSIICKQCGKIRELDKEVLVMHFPQNIEKPINSVAINRNEANDLMDRISGMKYLVSRERNTGIEYNGFNIDVDFTFLNFLNTMNFKQNVIIGSNHVNWHMCMAVALKKCLDEEAENFIVATPYVYDKDHLLPEITSRLEGRKDLKKVYLLSCLTWKRKSTNWSTETLKTFERCSEEELKRILENVENPSRQGTTEEMIEGALKKMKKDTLIRVKNGIQYSNVEENDER